MENCIFCRIIVGEIPSATVYENENYKAIMDIEPAAKGHVILLVKKHYANLFELGDEAAPEMISTVRKVAKAIQEEFGCDGINLLQNNGEAAGQSVFHFHIHVIPRYKDDHMNIPWTHCKYEEGEAESIAARLAARILESGR
jgi:histidine triad (HIT) family protein